MNNPVATFYQDSRQVAALRAVAAVVRVEGKLAGWLKPIELSRTLKDGLERALFETAERIEALKSLCQPNRQVTITQIIQDDPVSQARIEWELFRGAIVEGNAGVSETKEGVEILAQNNGVVASRFGRRIRLALQRAGESLDIGRSNVAQAQLKNLLDGNGGQGFSGSVVLPWIHPDIWPGDVVAAIDGRELGLGRERIVKQVTMRFGSVWTTTLDFGGAV